MYSLMLIGLFGFLSFCPLYLFVDLVEKFVTRVLVQWAGAMLQLLLKMNVGPCVLRVRFGLNPFEAYGLEYFSGC